ncbi:hypothetical protein KI688_007957 [Linnemannia hyalina]|uniref:Uncharacterized protein n=1 Tax=Linnemannia hyalina TaxID=64524 RepID=A0A9P8BWP4_9FUNG|nr:hypothetical protein KI688_007640 [Linnemannia hyalina]KAG9070421.1 hypothetical protein KI688_007957 [Linnemannia hyalina]
MDTLIPTTSSQAYAQKNGVSVSTASLLIGILNGPSALGRVSGLASDDIGDINTLLISTNCVSLSILIVWIFTGTSVPMMTTSCILYGFFSDSFVRHRLHRRRSSLCQGINRRLLQLWVGFVMAVSVVSTVVLKFVKNSKP